MTKARADNHPAPPEELQALCALCDVRWKVVPGRAANTWELYVYAFNRYGIAYDKYARTVQTVEYDVWNEIVKWLVSQRDGC